MAEGGSVSWLKGELLRRLQERGEFLKDGIAGGVPEMEYRQLVGRYKETARTQDLVEEIFAEFYSIDESESDSGELSDL